MCICFQSNKWTKKAITLTPVRYGCAFWPGTSYLTHVSVNYSDASVAIAHGGVELGQGINTKVDLLFMNYAYII